MIYTNTVSVRFTEQLATAMRGNPKVTAVLLTSSDETARSRLSGRNHGDDLLELLRRSDARALELESLTPNWVHRIATDGRTVQEIASELHALVGWT